MNLPSFRPHTHSTSKCHTQKVIPIGRFFSFLVHHFYDTGDPMFPIYASYHTALRSGSSDILATWPTVLEVQEHLLLPHNISARN